MRSAWIVVAALVLARSASADEDAPARTSGDVTRSLADLAVGFGLGSRHFAYHDPIGTNLRPYDVDGAPMLAIAVSLSPFADTRVMKDFGFYGDFESAFALQSRTASGAAVGTTWSRYDVGGRARLRLSDGPRPVMLGASLGYGLELFRFTDPTAIDPELPSVAYGFVRTMLDARVPFGPFSLSVAIAYLHVVANGEVGLRTRGTQNDGVEASFGGAFALGGGFEARLAGRYTRFFYSFDPRPGDAYVAGGALDQYLTGQLALAWVY